MSLTRESAMLFMVVAAKISASLSMIGSAFIIRDVLRKWQKNRRNQRHHLSTTSRIILSMSFADFGSSFFAHFLGTWLVPEEYGASHPFAAGNDATCKMQGIVEGFFSVAGALSNSTLATAYWLSVCRQMNEIKLRGWKWHYLLIGFPWIYSIIINLFKIVFGDYGPQLWYCHVSPDTFVKIELTVRSSISLFIIVFSMVALIRFVYSAEKRSGRHSIIDGLNRERSLQVTWQGLYFILSFMAVWVPAILPMFFRGKIPLWYYMFLSCIFPLQGLLNAIVYFRPKYLANRKQQMSSSGDGRSKLGSMLEILNISSPDGQYSHFSSVRSTINGFSRVTGIRKSITETEKQNEPTSPTSMVGLAISELSAKNAMSADVEKEDEFSDNGRVLDQSEVDAQL